MPPELGADPVEDRSRPGAEVPSRVWEHSRVDLERPDLEPSIAELFGAAVAAQANAHSPYSGYAVGAAIRTPSGAVFSGCNVENASYPEGTCAEAGAIAAMVAAGERTIVDIVTVTGGDMPGTPCGGCRQRIREFARPDTRIHSMTTAGVAITSTITGLLPDSFGPEHLGRPI